MDKPTTAKKATKKTAKKAPTKDKKPAGRPKNIQTPEAMKQYFDQYKTEVKSSPIMVHDFVGKDAEEVERKKERPLTMEGFENWLFMQGIITDVSDYFENKEKRYEIFVPICRAIKRIIRQDQIEGGMAGIYNPSITQRLNGLADKKEIDNRTIFVEVPEDDED